MQIAKDHVVSFEYTLTDPEGKVLDTSEGRAPLVYLHGIGGIIPGLEAAMEGRSVGDAFKATIDPEKAYGVRDERAVQTAPRSQFPAGQMIMVGQQLQANGPGGRQFNVRVTKVTDTEVTVDANHPLAGVPLTFDVKIVDIRPATDEEKQHRHAHGPGGHAH